MTEPTKPRRVAIIGSGISGLAAAWLLARHKDKFDVTLYESADYFGGHTHTVDVPSLKDPKAKVGVDTGFIVCNPITYPNFLAFLSHLSVPLARSDMSFSVSRNEGEFEWAGDNLNTVFAQRSNLLPVGHGQNGATFGMWGMITEVLRFHKQAAGIAEEADELQFNEKGEAVKEDERRMHPMAGMTLGEFFEKFGYSKFFYQNYVLPMTAAIWSTPANMTFDKFPLLTLVRFMRNHIMLQIGGRPKWRTVLNGSRTYVDAVLKTLNRSKTHLSTPITSITRHRSPTDANHITHITLTTASGATSTFDHLILATHTDVALRLLGDSATAQERQLLSTIPYVPNVAYLHRDASLMPKRRLAWSSWNYLTRLDDENESQSMCLTYWMNRLQPFVDAETYGDVFVTLNPLRKPAEGTVLGKWEYDHPLYSPDTVKAQDELAGIQNKLNTTFAGAWTNYGFHEDGLTSGLLAALSLGAECPFPVVLNGGYPTTRAPPSPPRWAVEMGVRPYKPARPLYLTKEDRERALRRAKGQLDTLAGGKVKAAGGGVANSIGWALVVLGVVFVLWAKGLVG
ncbi:hypothetical protein HK101_007676 [Irineochytrium annulatum]|nr:hypothetical protein HK101_007676 [Irineochytrium annulatum]